MRFLFLAFILSILSLQLQASCFDTLARFRHRLAATKKVLSENDEAYMQRLDRVERVGTWLRHLRKDKRPAIHAKMSRRMAKLDAYLFTADYATVHRELRSLFRQVEFSGHAITAINHSLELVKKSGAQSIDQLKTQLAAQDIPAKLWLERALNRATTVDAVIDELVSVRSSYEVKLGGRFQEYLLAKEHLEGLLEPNACSAECQSNIKRLIDSLGVRYQSDRTRFKNYLEIPADVSSDGLRRLIDEHRLASLVRLKHERNAEFVAVLSEFATQPAIVQKILNGLVNIPGMHQLRLVRLFKVFLDSVAQTKHVPEINKIVRSEVDALTKLDRVLAQNGLFKGNEFLISFARRGDLETKRVWNQIVSAASESRPQVADELLKADQLARARGVLELVNSNTALPRWLVLAAGGVGTGYYWFGKEEIVEIEKDPVIEDIPSIPLESEDDTAIEEASTELTEAPVVEALEIEVSNPERTPDSKMWWWPRFVMWLFS